MSEINMTQLLDQMRATAAAIQGNQKPQSTEGTSTGLNFSQALKTAVDKVNDTQMNAKQLVEAFETGNPNIDLPQVMVAMQKASVSFQTMLQVRNKLINAYEDIKRMPI